VPHDVRQRAAALAKRVQLARQAGTGDAWPLLTANSICARLNHVVIVMLTICLVARFALFMRDTSKSGSCRIG
jgi:hypothetical protein